MQAEEAVAHPQETIIQTLKQSGANLRTSALLHQGVLRAFPSLKQKDRWLQKNKLCLQEAPSHCSDLSDRNAQEWLEESQTPENVWSSCVRKKELKFLLNMCRSDPQIQKAPAWGRCCHRGLKQLVIPRVRLLFLPAKGFYGCTNQNQSLLCVYCLRPTWSYP